MVATTRPLEYGLYHRQDVSTGVTILETLSPYGPQLGVDYRSVSISAMGQFRVARAEALMRPQFSRFHNRVSYQTGAGCIPRSFPTP